MTFQLSGAGFASPEYRLTVLERPNLRDFKVRISLPGLHRPGRRNRATTAAT
ncbi:MAG: hypothetical protein WKG07_08340 [Hymenobacter sp.]